MSFKLTFGGSLTQYKTLGEQVTRRCLGIKDPSIARRIQAFLTGSTFLHEGVPTAQTVMASLRSESFTALLFWPDGWLSDARFGGMRVDSEQVVILKPKALHKDLALVFCVADVLRNGTLVPIVLVANDDYNWKRAMPWMGNRGEIIYRISNGAFLTDSGRELKVKFDELARRETADDVAPRSPSGPTPATIPVSGDEMGPIRSTGGADDFGDPT